MKYLKSIIMTAIAAVAATNSIVAQPSAVKKAEESVFTLTTFNKDGGIIASSHGVFTGSNGEAISNLKPFIGAQKAVVVDKKGHKYDVTRIVGVNEIYDVAKFKINGTTKSASTATANEGSTLWLLPYSIKGGKPIEAKVKSVEKFMNTYSYYIFDLVAPANTEACPFVNDAGQIIGLLQTSATSNIAHATDAAFINGLSTNGLTINDATMKSIGIPAALPEDKEQAVLALMMMGQGTDSLKYATLAGDFISKYPQMIDGYMAKAQIETDGDNFTAADKHMQEAIKNVTEKDDAHYNFAKLIYAKELYKKDSPYPAWTLDKALQEINTAYSIKPLPLYKSTEGDILYAKGNYNDAYNIYLQLANGKMRSGDIFYNAALCKEKMGGPDTEIINLLDSAVNNTDTLNIRSASKYFLMRGDVYNRMKNYRQAVFDYTRYEVLNRGTLNANFYYIREQAEVNARLFKQALADIDAAIYLSPKEPTFIAEKASLLLRLNMLKEAEEAAKNCVEMSPEFSDAYLILGLSQIKTGRKQEGKANLNKAKDLGNPQAQGLIDKYGK